MKFLQNMFYSRHVHIVLDQDAVLWQLINIPDHDVH